MSNCRKIDFSILFSFLGAAIFIILFWGVMYFYVISPVIQKFVRLL